MTSVEAALLALGLCMLGTSLWAWRRTHSSVAVAIVVGLYLGAAYYAGLIA